MSLHVYAICIVKILVVGFTIYSMSICHVDDLSTKCVSNPRQGADLVITGHSLGAGVAALLAILLRHKYPDLRCFAFAPPGELCRCVVWRIV